MSDGVIQSRLAFALMFMGIVAAVVVAIVMVRLSQRAALPYDSAKANPVAPPEFGVVGEIISGGEARPYRAASLDLQIEPGVIHDPSLPDEPFEGRFTVTFDRGRVQYARIGAEFQGGSLIIMRGEEVLLSDYADPERVKMILARIPVQLTRRREQITYIFQTDAQGPAKLKAIWQPEGEEAVAALGAGVTK